MTFRFRHDVTILLRPAPAPSTQFDLWLGDDQLAVGRPAPKPGGKETSYCRFGTADQASEARAAALKDGYLPLGMLSAAEIGTLSADTLIDAVSDAVNRRWANALTFAPSAPGASGLLEGPELSLCCLGIAGACAIAARHANNDMLTCYITTVVEHHVAGWRAWRENHPGTPQAREADAAIQKLAASLRQGPPALVALGNRWLLEESLAARHTPAGSPAVIRPRNQL